MKEFEKWCDEIEYLCVDYTKRDSMRRAWRAALKCVKEFADSETCSRIDEELQNGNV